MAIASLSSFGSVVNVGGGGIVAIVIAVGTRFTAIKTCAIVNYDREFLLGIDPVVMEIVVTKYIVIKRCVAIKY